MDEINRKIRRTLKIWVEAPAGKLFPPVPIKENGKTYEGGGWRPQHTCGTERGVVSRRVTEINEHDALQRFLLETPNKKKN